MEDRKKMKKVKDADEMKEVLLEDKEGVIGRTVEFEGGFKYLATGINEHGIIAIPFDDLINLKKGDLEKRLAEIFPPEKIAIAMRTVEKRKSDINGIYS